MTISEAASKAFKEAHIETNKDRDLCSLLSLVCWQREPVSGKMLLNGIKSFLRTAAISFYRHDFLKGNEL